MHLSTSLTHLVCKASHHIGNCLCCLHFLKQLNKCSKTYRTSFDSDPCCTKYSCDFCKHACHIPLQMFRMNWHTTCYAQTTIKADHWACFEDGIVELRKRQVRILLLRSWQQTPNHCTELPPELCHKEILSVCHASIPALASSWM